MGLQADVVAPYVDYSGGLNSTDNPLAVQENESTDCLNVHTSVFKSVEKRRGFIKLNPTVISGSPTGNAMFDFALTDSNHILTGIFSDTLYKMDELDGVWDAITMTVTIGSGRAELRKFGSSLVIFSRVSGNVQSWNGSAGSTSTISGAVAFRYGWADDNVGRVFASGRPSFEGVAYFTPVNSLSFTVADDSIQVSNIFDVVGFRSLKGKLFSMTTGGWFRIDDLGGNPRFGVKWVAGPGTRSPDTAVNVQLPGLGEGIIYLDVNRRLQFFNGFDTVPLSQRFERRTSFSSAHTLDRADRSTFANFHAIYNPDRDWYMLFYAEDSDSTPNNVMVYDVYGKSAWPFEGITASSACVAVSGTNRNRVLFSNNAGQTYEFDSGVSDDGAAIASYYEFARRTPARGYIHKFRDIAMTLKTTGDYTLALRAKDDFRSSFRLIANIPLSGSGDLLGSSFIIGTSVLGGTDVKIVTMGLDIPANLIQLRLEDSTDNPAWQLFGDSLASKRIQVT